MITGAFVNLTIVACLPLLNFITKVPLDAVYGAAVGFIILCHIELELSTLHAAVYLNFVIESWSYRHSNYVMCLNVYEI